MLRIDTGGESGLDFSDADGFENEDIALDRVGEVVADFINEDLVARVDAPASDGFPLAVKTPRAHAKVLRDLRDGGKGSVGFLFALDFGEYEEVKPSLLADRNDGIVLVAFNIDVILAEDKKF